MAVNQTVYLLQVDGFELEDLLLQ